MSEGRPINVLDIPGTGPRPKKSYVATAKELVAKYKKSCIAVVLGVVILAIVMIVWAYNWPSGFVADWKSPDFKLLKKNHTSDSVRSDNKVENWSKNDYKAAVEKFNSLIREAAD